MSKIWQATLTWNTQTGISLFPLHGFVMAVDCIRHCVSIEAPSLTTTVISPFCTLGILQWTSPCFPISLPNLDWQATFVFLHLICIFIIIIIFISTCCLRELTSEQYAHVKISNGTLAFYELMMICSICSTFTELSCKLMLFYVQKHSHTQTHIHLHTHVHSDTPLWWQPCSF